MSEQPQKSRRTPLRPKSTQEYQPASPQQQSYAQYQQSIPAAPPSRQDAPLPSQPVQQERVVVVRQSTGNPVGKFFSIITYPFRKVFGAILWLVQIIIGAMIRSVVSFIIGIILTGLLVTLIGVYGVALFDSNMDFMQAFTLSYERIVDFFRMLVGRQPAIQSFIAWGIRLF
jgi:hypothetical protein